MGLGLGLGARVYVKSWLCALCMNEMYAAPLSDSNPNINHPFILGRLALFAVYPSLHKEVGTKNTSTIFNSPPSITFFAPLDSWLYLSDSCSVSDGMFILMMVGLKELLWLILCVPRGDICCL